MHGRAVALPSAMSFLEYLRFVSMGDADTAERQTSTLSRSGPERQEDDGALPAYLRIVRRLTERVDSGDVRRREPPAFGLGAVRAEFGVSPMTVRRALSLLEQQGLVTGEKGRGTFARSRDLADSVFRLDSLTGEWLDESAEIRLLSASMTRADERVAAMLASSPGEQGHLPAPAGVLERDPGDVPHRVHHLRSAPAAGGVATPVDLPARVPGFGRARRSSPEASSR